MSAEADGASAHPISRGECRLPRHGAGRIEPPFGALSRLRSAGDPAGLTASHILI